MSAGHSTLGGSSAERWISCPGSIRLAAELPSSVVERSSRAAAEGTAAHQLLEWCLKSDKSPDEFPMKEIAVKDWPKERFEVDDEMKDAVQVCLDLVAEIPRRVGPMELFVEKHVKPLPERDDIWGTADVRLLENFGELHVIDYKHGKGHLVDVECNPQLMFYGLGALESLREEGYDDVTKVVLWIVQPRGRSIGGEITEPCSGFSVEELQALSESGVRHWATTVEELDHFAGVLRAAAQRTEEPDAPLVSGDHCTFCPAKAVCPTLESDVLALFGEPEFSDSVALADPPRHDPARIGKLLGIVERWDLFVRALKDLAQRMAEDGQDVAGWKLVRKRSNRRWKVDEAEVLARLESFSAVDPADLVTTPQLRSPAQVEKALTRAKVKKKVRDEVLEKLVEKPEGGLTLVPNSDGRPRVEAQNPLDLFPEIGDSPADG